MSHHPTAAYHLRPLPHYRPSVVLQATCLKPQYSLRRQLLVSFGATSVLSIIAVLSMAISGARHAGQIVKDQAHDAIRDQVLVNLQHKSFHIAAIMTRKLGNLGATAAIMEEITRDRIVGYPNDGYQDDRHVPFYDPLQGRNVYPLRGRPLPLNWQIVLNVNETNKDEHVQERWRWYTDTPISTVSASYTFQGVCDPKATINQTFYAPNCTDDNNNITTGGVFTPTVTNQYLYDKSKELGLFLKPLWEAVPVAYSMGIYFANSGAGSLVSFPPKYTKVPGSYKSIGCDWMNATNNFTGKPLATPEEIARCHPNGHQVPQLEYNPLERSWCREEALRPNETISFGPYLNVGQGRLWLVTVGRAVFDRRTGEFIACTLIDVAVQELVDVIQAITTAGQSFANVSLVNWDDGTVVAGPYWNAATANDTIRITDTDLIEKYHFDQIRSLLNFSQPWDPQVVRKVQVVDHGDAGVVTAYPVPVPPKTYDLSYRPVYMILFRVDNKVFQPILNIQHSIDDDVALFTKQTIFVGVSFGFILVLMVICLFVRVLTKPLLWMQSVAWGIVNHTNERVTAEDLLNSNHKRSDGCAPKTEITSLVSEFRMMIRGFSRDGAATVAPSVLHEISNQVTWQDEFAQLYTKMSRRTSFLEAAAVAAAAAAATSTTISSEQSLPVVASKLSAIDEESVRIVAAADSDLTDSADCESPPQRNCGDHENYAFEGKVAAAPRINKEHSLPLSTTMEDNQLHRYLKNDLNIERIRVCRSPLFWWILFAFIMPVTISYAVVYTLGRNQVVDILPTWLASAESVSMAIQVDTVMSAASLRAALVEAIIYGVSRDLHLLTRFAGWLLFDGINRSTSFTELIAATEECKNFSKFGDDKGVCPFFLDRNRAPCDCAWDDAHNLSCITFLNSNKSRYLQRRFFAGQAKGANLLTGDRNHTTASKTPGDTLWWNDTRVLPGVRQGASARGYATIYDRVRVTSALAAVEFPIYNFAGTSGQQPYNLGTFTAFEADGLMTGYDGCQYGFVEYARFQLTNSNLASEIGGQDLCPVNSYGYDPRCSGWFAIGKNSSKTNALYVGPPEILVGSETLGSTSTSPLTDPTNEKYVGQTMMQFSTSAMQFALDISDVNFSFVITPTSSFLGGDTVVVSNHTPNGSVPIKDMILPFDRLPGSPNQLAFANIITDMKAGMSGNRTLSRSRSDGTQESFLLVYSPIMLRTMKAEHSYDFSRGINVSRALVYSIAVASDQKGLNSSFDQTKKNVGCLLERRGLIYTVSILSAYVIVCAFTSLIAMSVTKPVIILLRAVRNINAGRIEHDIPPMHGGSREVNQVYNSFAKLYKIVRFSNSAFFSGNLNRAFHFISDALDLFRKIDDQKAIGIASNNLGNTLLAMYREKGCKSIGKCCCLMDGICVVGTARRHMDEAVRIATLDFDQVRPDDVKAEYAQQLANRHFNRAMLCLVTQHDPCSSDGDREQGYRDLLRTRQLDCDVRDFWMARMLVLKNSDAYFNRLIRRIRGLVDLCDDETVRTIWNAKELVDETDRLLFAAWSEVEAPIFRHVGRFGRLQQLEKATIRLELALNNTAEAARLGMRMLVEDEFLIESAFVCASTAVLRFAISSGWTARSVAAFKRDLRKMVKSCKHSVLDLGRTFVFCMEFSYDDMDVTTKIYDNVLKLFDQYCLEDDCVGLVRVVGHENLGFDLACNRHGRQERRQKLDSARLQPKDSKVSPSLHAAIQMATAASQQCMENPVFLIAVMDGVAWDTNSFGQVQDQLVRWQGQGKSTIHVILVGYELPDHVADQCRILCQLSRTSSFISADSDTMDSAFEQVASLMNVGRGTTTEAIHGGITMEKF